TREFLLIKAAKIPHTIHDLSSFFEYGYKKTGPHCFVKSSFLNLMTLGKSLLYFFGFNSVTAGPFST
ncbi:MAG: hypothetical protein IJ042_00760, partial [Butyricicoccus sp.]|nr:hypothetical protein [Butyricicoccus sp.]